MDELQYYLVNAQRGSRCDQCGISLLVGDDLVYCKDVQATLCRMCANRASITWWPARTYVDQT
jgi:hypothetical protein